MLSLCTLVFLSFVSLQLFMYTIYPPRLYLHSLSQQLVFLSLHCPHAVFYILPYHPTDAMYCSSLFIFLIVFMMCRIIIIANNTLRRLFYKLEILQLLISSKSKKKKRRRKTKKKKKKTRRKKKKRNPRRKIQASKRTSPPTYLRV